MFKWLTTTLLVLLCFMIAMVAMGVPAAEAIPIDYIGAASVSVEETDEGIAFAGGMGLMPCSADRGAIAVSEVSALIDMKAGALDYMRITPTVYKIETEGGDHLSTEGGMGGVYAFVRTAAESVLI